MMRSGSTSRTASFPAPSCWSPARASWCTAEAIGFQDKETGKPMAKDSIFRIYSMTKPLVSVAAMMLVEDGKIAAHRSGLEVPAGHEGPCRSAWHEADAEFAEMTYSAGRRRIAK